MADRDMTRFSDEQLIELRRDLDRHVEEEMQKWDEITRMVDKNTRSTERIAVALERHVDSTAELVSIYSDLKGAARTGKRVRNFVLWLTSLGGAGAVIAAGLSHILKVKVGG